MGLILVIIILFYILNSIFGKKYDRHDGNYEEYDPKEWNSRKEWYNKSYLKSEHWKCIREHALVEAGFYCRCCGSNKRLTVHHIIYDNIGHEKDEDLKVLCWSCHKEIHRGR